MIDPRQAVVEVSDYRNQTSQFAQTTLRSVLGEAELDELGISIDEGVTFKGSVDVQREVPKNELVGTTALSPKSK